MNISLNKHGKQKRLQILDVIIAYIDESGYPPTVREIGERVGLKSTSSVQNHLIRMLDEGMIETDEKICSARAIRVPGYKFVKENNYDKN